MQRMATPNLIIGYFLIFSRNSLQSEGSVILGTSIRTKSAKLKKCYRKSAFWLIKEMELIADCDRRIVSWRVAGGS